MPGLFRSAFNLIFYSDGGARNRWWVTDRERGERFKLSKDEDHMMMVLGENLLELREKHVASLSKRFSYQPWTTEQQDIARDHVLRAIVKRRDGDTSEWERLKAMTSDQWHEWLEGMLDTERK
jgi:hypothetical protein